MAEQSTRLATMASERDLALGNARGSHRAGEANHPPTTGAARRFNSGLVAGRSGAACRRPDANASDPNCCLGSHRQSDDLLLGSPPLALAELA